MTVIYVDSVFLLNTAADYLLLLSAASLAGIPLHRIRYLLAALLGGSWDDECWTMRKDALILSVTAVESGVAGLGKAEVLVSSVEGELLFALQAAWQEVSGHG